MHSQAFDYVQQVFDRFGPFHSVVDLGGRNVNGSIKDIFAGAKYLAVDISPGEGVDIVADAADWKPTEKFDCVVTTETLEHTPKVEAIVHNIAKILRSGGGGRTIITCASSPRMPHSGRDGASLQPNEYYSNVEPASMIQYMQEAGFEEIEVEKKIYPDHGGDLYATGIITA